ncbi:hypothetical protein ACOSQ4_005467 [Xanthoceras sorbifolium]
MASGDTGSKGQRVRGGQRRRAACVKIKNSPFWIPVNFARLRVDDESGNPASPRPRRLASLLLSRFYSVFLSLPLSSLGSSASSPSSSVERPKSLCGVLS